MIMQNIAKARKELEKLEAAEAEESAPATPTVVSNGEKKTEAESQAAVTEVTTEVAADLSTAADEKAE